MCLEWKLEPGDKVKLSTCTLSLVLQVLKMMVGSNLKDTQLQQIVDKTILFADKDEDGKISFEEFCSVSAPSVVVVTLCSRTF